MAATSVLKLVVDDQQYEASLRQARQGLQHLQQSLQDAGKSFADCDGAMIDYARGLGEMESTSKSARGQINDLSTTFVELSRVYQQMTDQEKQSPIGQAMSQSLQQLRQRTIDAKQELSNLNNQLEPVKEQTSQTGGILGMLSEKLTLNVDAMKLFDVGLSAVKGALNVVGDAFMASEANVDEWGRVTASAKDLYDGFLTALNTGDISGYLSRINDIINAARAAYDELDKLGTMKTIQAPLVSNQQAEIERLRGMLQTGTYVEKKNGYETIGNLIGLQNGDKLSPELIRIIENQLSKGTQKIVDLWDNEIDQSGKAIDALYNQQAVKIGMSLSEFRKGTSSWEEFSRNLEGYRKYQQFENEHTQVYSSYSPTLGTNVSSSHRDDVANPYEQYKRWGVFRFDGEEFNNLVSLIQQRDQQIMQAYSQQIQAQRTINRAEGFSVRQIMGGGGSGGGGGKSGQLSPIDQAANDVAKAEQEYADAISNAQQKLLENMIKSDDYDKQVLDGQKRLADAYLKAYNATGDETYLNSFRDTAQHVIEMQGVVDANAQAQKAAEKAARELEQAQKKLAEAQEKEALLIQSWQSPNAKGISTFISHQQSALSLADYGSTDYSQLQASIADAQVFSNIMSKAIQEGLNDIVVDSSALWQQIIGEADIDDKTWQALIERINEKLKEVGKDAINIDLKTGKISQARGNDLKEVTQLLGQMTSGVSSITGGLQQLGVEIPEGLSKTIGAIQAIGGILTGITAILTLISSKQTAEMVSSFIPGFSGGGIIHAANGYLVPGNDHSDRTLIAASSGEMVLNEFQQQALAGSLKGAGSLHVTGVLKGEDMLVSIDRTARRKGYGELAFWHN